MYKMTKENKFSYLINSIIDSYMKAITYGGADHNKMVREGSLSVENNPVTEIMDKIINGCCNPKIYQTRKEIEYFK